MAGVEEKDIDRLLANPPEKVEIEVKYKIDVTVMEGVSKTILKKVILVLLKISRMIKSKCTFCKYCSHRIFSLLIIQSIISYKNQKYFNQFTMSLLFCVILFYRFFLVSAAASVGTEQRSTGPLVPLYLPLSEFVNTDGTI